MKNLLHILKLVLVHRYGIMVSFICVQCAYEPITLPAKDVRSATIHLIVEAKGTIWHEARSNFRFILTARVATGNAPRTQIHTVLKSI